MKNTARVYVLPPTRMEIVEHIVEAEIGTAIQVPLALYTIRPNDPNRTEVPYSSCSKLPIQVYVDDPNFVYDDKTHYPNLKPACVVLPIMGNALGSAKVTATYSVEDKYFESSVIVSTFKPLRVSNIHFRKFLFL
jgi:nuclear pore complex protein Nup210